ncbi:MAG: ATP-binding cassette domain-containing protein [Candidatus Marinimicrobia bacterium]|nr:ATP-binding cassette domain-containing protein [Candidatus Neomarinimicrobiota bacterium]
MIKVDHLIKEFKLNRRQRREMGEAFKKARAITAVNDISFECTPGKIFGLLGPNGAGKTTTLRMIATMLKPTAGNVIVAGYEVNKEPQKVRENIGFMTGQTALYDRLTPNEMVKYIADLHGMDSAVMKRRRDQIFTLLDMHDFAKRRIGRLSSGMKQKTSIARNIIHDPDIMVFDEPTSGLDVMTSRAIIDLIHSCKEQGKTVIFSTHRMGEVKLICDDIAIIHKGKLFFNGALEKFEAQMIHSSFEDEFIHMVEEA